MTHPCLGCAKHEVPRAEVTGLCEDCLTVMSGMLPSQRRVLRMANGAELVYGGGKPDDAPYIGSGLFPPEMMAAFEDEHERFMASHPRKSD